MTARFAVHCAAFSLLLLTLACARLPMPYTDDAAEIRALWERGGAALCSGDWNSYQELWAHTPSVEVIHPDQRDWRVGWEVIGSAYRELLTSGFRCEAQTRRMRIHVSASREMAWATAEVVLRIPGSESSERVLWQTLVFEKLEGRWRLVHGHASVPAQQ